MLSFDKLICVTQHYKHTSQAAINYNFRIQCNPKRCFFSARCNIEAGSGRGRPAQYDSSNENTTATESAIIEHDTHLCASISSGNTVTLSFSRDHTWPLQLPKLVVDASLAWSNLS